MRSLIVRLAQAWPTPADSPHEHSAEFRAARLRSGPCSPGGPRRSCGRSAHRARGAHRGARPGRRRPCALPGLASRAEHAALMAAFSAQDGNASEVRSVNISRSGPALAVLCVRTPEADPEAAVFHRSGRSRRLTSSGRRRSSQPGRNARSSSTSTRGGSPATCSRITQPDLVRSRSCPASGASRGISCRRTRAIS